MEFLDAGSFRAVGDVPRAISVDDRSELVAHDMFYRPRKIAIASHSISLSPRL